MFPADEFGNPNQITMRFEQQAAQMRIELNAGTQSFAVASVR